MSSNGANPPTFSLHVEKATFTLAAQYSCWHEQTDTQPPEEPILEMRVEIKLKLPASKLEDRRKRCTNRRGYDYKLIGILLLLSSRAEMDGFTLAAIVIVAVVVGAVGALLVVLVVVVQKAATFIGAVATVHHIQ